MYGFRYEKNSDDILKGLSFKVHENEFYTIVGSNGVGRVLRCLLFQRG